MSAPHILIIGGGITGLSAAYYLELLAAAKGQELEITLVEKDARLGGKVGTETADGFLVDIGPDSFISLEPWAVDLCRELGMEDEVRPPIARQFYMLHDGELHSVPHELVSLVPSKPEALWKTTFLSVGAKMRASSEGLVKQRSDIEDESLSSFMRRRFGDDFAAHFAEPLMGGVHAGDPERMSMAAIYPMYWQMEKQYGSVTRALLERRLHAKPASDAQPASPFVALLNGMQSLIDRLCHNLTTTRILTETTVEELTPAEDGRVIARLSKSQTLRSDGVLLTAPAYTASKLVQPFSAEAAQILSGITYVSTAVVTLAYRREDVDNPLDGTGFLVPRDQGLSITGCTWSNKKWENRAPEGAVLLRSFIGHAGKEEKVRNSTDEELKQIVHAELSGILGIRQPPIFARVHRWLNAMPQYEVGHLERMAHLDAALNAYPGLILTGSAYRGVGVPDCIRQAKESAEKAFALLSGQSD